VSECQHEALVEKFVHAHELVPGKSGETIVISGFAAAYLPDWDA
jgi:hypothetical protein